MVDDRKAFKTRDLNILDRYMGLSGNWEIIEDNRQETKHTLYIINITVIMYTWTTIVCCSYYRILMKAYSILSCNKLQLSVDVHL